MKRLCAGKTELLLILSALMIFTFALSTMALADDSKWSDMRWKEVKWPAKTGKIKIGLIDLVSSTETSAFINKVCEEEATKRGWEFTVMNLQMNTALAPGYFQNFIASGYSAVVMHWTPPRLVAKQVKEAYDKQIPFVTIGGGEVVPWQTAEFGFMDASDGAAAAKYIASRMPQGGKVIIIYIATTSNNIQKYAGAKAQFEALKIPVAHEHSILTGEPEPETYETVKNVLLGDTKHEIKGIWTAFDGLGLAAARACKELGRDDVINATLDDAPRALKALRDGQMDCLMGLSTPLVHHVKANEFPLFDKIFAGEAFKLGQEKDLERIVETRDNIPPEGYFYDPCGYEGKKKDY